MTNNKRMNTSKKTIKRFNTIVLALLIMFVNIFSIGLNTNTVKAASNTVSLHVWVSETGMGEQIPDTTFNNHWYYLCYELLDGNGKRIGGSYRNYSATEYIYAPNGELIHTCSYSNSDNNWIAIKNSGIGRFKGRVSVTGDINVNCDVEWDQEDGTISLKTGEESVSLNTAIKSSFINPCHVFGDLSGRTYYLNVSNSNSSVCRTSWGNWNGNQCNLTIYAKEAGKSSLTIKLIDSNSNEILAQKNVNVYVIKPETKPESTTTPTVKPTVAPTATPTVKPTATPTVAPTATPTASPVSNYSFDNVYYSFCNSRSGLGYPSNYRIPLSIFGVLYSPSKAQYFYDLEGQWGGSCFGFASSSIIMNTKDYDIKPYNFKASSTKPADLKPDDVYSTNFERFSVKQMLEILQVSQYSDSVQRRISYNKGRYASQDMLDCLTNIDEKKAVPVVLGIYKYGVGGHALVALGIEECTDDYDKLLVYDCNYAGVRRYIKLFKGSNGRYNGGWEYNLNDTWMCGSNYTNDSISFVDMATIYDIWKGRSKTIMNNNMNLIHIKTVDDLDIFDGNENKVAVIRSGEFLSYSNKECFPIEIMRLNTDAQNADEFNFYLDEGEYSFVPVKKNKVDIQMEVIGDVKQSRCSTTCEKISVTLDEVKNVLSLTKADEYCISLTSDDQEGNVEKKGNAFGQNIHISQGEPTEEADKDVCPTKEPNAGKVDATKKEVKPDKESVSEKKQDKASKATEDKLSSVKGIKVKRKRDTLKITWKKSKKVDGYIVEVSTKKSFREKRSIFVSGKKTTVIFKKIERKKCYVRVRAFKKNKHGSWSKLIVCKK